jgi:hypothetical protein
MDDFSLLDAKSPKSVTTSRPLHDTFRAAKTQLSQKGD